MNKKSRQRAYGRTALASSRIRLRFEFNKTAKRPINLHCEKRAKRIQ